jgi:hypothetical protein
MKQDRQQRELAFDLVELLDPRVSDERVRRIAFEALVKLYREQAEMRERLEGALANRK